MSQTMQLLLLGVGIIVGLGVSLWLARAVLREMAKGWALDERRRGADWQRGQEDIRARDASHAPAQDDPPR